MASPAPGRKRGQEALLSGLRDKENVVTSSSSCPTDGDVKRRTVDSSSQVATADAVLPEAPAELEGSLSIAGAAGLPEPAQHQGDGPADDVLGQPEPEPTAPAKPLPRRFASRSFYGSRLQQASSAVSSRQQQVEDRVLRFLANVQRRMQARAAAGMGQEESAPAVWRVFATQQPAFELADLQPGLEVFSVEYGQEGKRRFIATSRNEFLRRYVDMLPQHRHYYEIIRQGHPCHLYFDLEFQPADNPGLDGTAAVDAVLSLVRDQLLSRFQLDLQDGWVLELDSSTEAKFSRHLIIRIPGAAFASNAHAGAFALQLCAAAKERRGEDARCAMLVVKKGSEGEEALFIDPAVYSRNRAFRLYLSSKCGKQAVLENTGRFGGEGMTIQECFEASLVTNVPAGMRLLRCFDESAEEAAAAAARATRLAAAAQLQSLKGIPRGALPSGIGQVCYGPCPYPELEAFISSVACQGSVPGSVRSWALLEDVGLMIMNIRGNRFCGNVGRAHKSNGIFFVVDLREGSWYQKCYDPDCRHYRSPLMPLPPGLLGLWRQQQQQQPDGPCGSGGSGGYADCGSDADRHAGSGEAGDDDEELMLQALEQYERRQQQQQQQQQGEARQAEFAGDEQRQARPQHGQQQHAQQGRPAELQGKPSPPVAAAAAPEAGAGGDAEDAFLLEALLHYEQQAGLTPPPAAPAGANQQAQLGLPAAAAAPQQQQQADSTAGGVHQVPGCSTGAVATPVAQPPGAGQNDHCRGQQRQQQARKLENWEKFL